MSTVTAHRTVFDRLGRYGFCAVLNPKSAEPSTTTAHPLDPIVPVWYSHKAGPSAMVLHQVLSQCALGPSLTTYHWTLDELARHIGNHRRPVTSHNHTVINSIDRMVRYIPGVWTDEATVFLPQSIQMPRRADVAKFDGMQAHLHQRWLNG